MKIVDAHCHLESPELKDDLHKLLNDAYREGVVKIITSSVIIDEWYISKNISKNFPEVEYTVGVHPWYVKDSHFDIYKKLGEFYTENRDLIAIGEIGLDKKIDSPPFSLQQMIFEEQMKFAVDVNLPVIIHCRGAFNELAESLKKVGMPKRGGIIHAFSGSVDIALTFIKKGISFSMGGALTYKPSKKRIETLRVIYPEHFLLETDSPDIPPVGTEKPNVPANIILNLKGAEAIIGRSAEEIAEITTKNAERIFNLKI